MRILLALLLALSGCAQPPVGEAPPEALLVRGFVDDLDQDGQTELHIRFGALVGNTVEPFDGTVDILLMPEGRSLLPKAWTVRVTEADFTDDVLPYYEIIDTHTWSRPGNVVIEGEARLVEGHIIEGSYETNFRAADA